MNINEFEWHDSILESIIIDREKPGLNDSILLKIFWWDKKRSIIEFFDCYAFYSKMNFGIVADETISEVTMSMDSLELKKIREDWKSMNINLDNLKHYKLITNSTNSILDIFSLDFRNINEEHVKKRSRC